MNTWTKSAGLAGIFAIAAGFAPALDAATLDTGSTVREGQAVMTQLGADTSALTYWVSRPDGWHVVTTIDAGAQADAAHHVILRVSEVLLPGQAELISVPAAPGAHAQQLRIRRLADRIEVASVPASAV
jgi:hypothetical protein